VHFSPSSSYLLSLRLLSHIWSTRLIPHADDLCYMWVFFRKIYLYSWWKFHML
jgi:hypothetical protein